jgi:hypothetical protein
MAMSLKQKGTFDKISLNRQQQRQQIPPPPSPRFVFSRLKTYFDKFSLPDFNFGGVGRGQGKNLLDTGRIEETNWLIKGCSKNIIHPCSTHQRVRDHVYASGQD